MAMEIMQKVAAISDGNVKIGSGTMYGAVSNMLKKVTGASR